MLQLSAHNEIVVSRRPLWSWFQGVHAQHGAFHLGLNLAKENHTPRLHCEHQR